ncbi:amphoterin-induced protein 2 [Ochotona princeps]|uniref:amphoterin-induced protein 2 n=1 Tax=Ochotona princeps TaxID=9978 RepID=UPI0027155CD1|nr:amphoterin-induced protein 2 [Ochotona princeps]
MSARPRCRGLLCLLAVTAAVRPGASGLCPAACTCATDVISCTDRNLSKVPANLFRLVRRLDLSYNRIGVLDSEWIPAPLLQLSTLVVRHNYIASISAGSFATIPNVRNLDLSSNRLQVVRDAAFQELRALEMLLLYDNRISHLDPSAFGGLARLQRLYLSGNALTQFPVGLYLGRFKLAALTFLDVSYNLITALPVHRMHVVPGKQLRGVYLHGNPFVCDCALHSLLALWYRRHYSAVVEFQDHYTCRPIAAGAGSGQQVQLLRENFLNCSVGSANGSFHALGFIHEAQVGQRLVVHCDGKAGTAHTDFLWVGPDSRLLEPGRTTDNFHVFYNGSLVIESLRLEDAGVYSCIAMNRQRLLNESVDVTVTVSNSSASRAHSHEAFNTAFTTLAACVASIVLVLLYLYLTPCPCKCRAYGPRSTPTRGNMQAASLCPGPSDEGCVAEPRAGAGKRVVFLEPLKEAVTGQNGRVPLFPGEATLAEGILRAPQGKADSGSVSSGFSDTPFVASA